MSSGKYYAYWAPATWTQLYSTWHRYGLGLYLFYYVYQDGLTSTFVSLDIGAGPPTCKEIPIFLNGYFQADENGNWRSSKKFDPNKVMYGVILEGVQVTQKTWSDVVDYACKTYRYRTYCVETFTLTSAYNPTSR